MPFTMAEPIEGDYRPVLVYERKAGRGELHDGRGHSGRVSSSIAIEAAGIERGSEELRGFRDRGTEGAVQRKEERW